MGLAVRLGDMSSPTGSLRLPETERTGPAYRSTKATGGKRMLVSLVKSEDGAYRVERVVVCRTLSFGYARLVRATPISAMGYQRRGAYT